MFSLMTPGLLKFCFIPNSAVSLFAAKTDEVLKAKVAKREEEARKKLEEGELFVFSVIDPTCELWLQYQTSYKRSK